MSSKLFHTVVAFGITLGAASVGCSAEPVEAPASSESAVVSKDDTQPTETAAPTHDCDRVCEVAWPTTKGGPRPSQAQACIDPTHACGDYPGGLFSQETCYEVQADGATCNVTKEVWMFCKDTGTSKEWTCPSGTVKVDQCVWPAPEGG